MLDQPLAALVVLLPRMSHSGFDLNHDAAASFRARPHPADLVVARHSERIEHAGVLLGEEGLILSRGEERVAGADVDAAARDRGARPDRAQGRSP